MEPQPIEPPGIFSNISRNLKSYVGERTTLPFLFSELGVLSGSDHLEFPENLTSSQYTPILNHQLVVVFSASKSKPGRTGSGRPRLPSDPRWSGLGGDIGSSQLWKNLSTGLTAL